MKLSKEFLLYIIIIELAFMIGMMFGIACIISSM